MPRIVKKAKVRRDEIMDAASRLFVAKGYAATTINDLLDEVGIARGTLYHHFTSKEEVLDGLIGREGDRLLAAVQTVAASDASALPKLTACVAALVPHDADQTALIDELSGADNSAMFQKSLDDMVVRLAPVIAGIVAQGVTEGVFHVSDPLTAIRVLLAAAHALLDNPALAWSAEQRQELTAGFIDATERVLGAQHGLLVPMIARISQ